MDLRRFPARSAALLLVLAACGAAEPAVTEAVAETPPLTWQQVRATNILCLVAPGATPVPPGLQTRLCEKVRALAARGAPMPVATIGFGDPIVLDRDTATLLVHAAVSEETGRPLLAFTIRTYRPNRTDADILFGAPPRAVPLGGPDLNGPELDRALAETLAQTLPWLARP